MGASFQLVVDFRAVRVRIMVFLSITNEKLVDYRQRKPTNFACGYPNRTTIQNFGPGKTGFSSAGNAADSRGVSAFGGYCRTGFLGETKSVLLRLRTLDHMEPAGMSENVTGISVNQRIACPPVMSQFGDPVT